MHGCLHIWNFSSRVQLDISLIRCAHLLSYRVKHSKRNSISTRAHVLFFMYRKLIRALLVAVTNCGKKKNQVWYTLQSLELLYLVDLLCVLVKS